jgi:CRP-like cAMP-binding protein
MARRQSVPISRPENRLLAALPKRDFDLLTARMDVVSFAVRDVVYRPNGPVDHVYFPLSGLLSMVVTLEDGATSEVGVVGNEGMAGVPAFLGADRSPNQVFCQNAGEARRMPAAEFREAVRPAGPFQRIVQRYTLALFHLIGQSTACNHHHPVERRLARWLLMTQDRVGADEFPLTQEFLATMLGVHRPSVTVVARTLQKAGLIRYTRGRITVLDREGLESASCECYRVVRAELDRLVP